MQKIESTKNEQIKQINKLKQKKYRQQTNTYLLEGWHVIKEALTHQPAEILTLLMTNDHFEEVDPFLVNAKFAVLQISPQIAEILSDTVHTDGIFAVAKLPDPQKIELDIEKPWLVLDHIADPGNAGTMVRTADAAGYAGVVFSAGAIDPFNSKVVRAMQGSQFHLQVLQLDDLEAFLTAQRKKGYRLFGTLVDDSATDIREVTLKDQHYVLMMGNEAHGLSPELAEIANDNLYLPIFGNAESLNVAIAAAVIMYQLQMKL
ncbi:TrmH family RNA methyltransferase [Lapidilactobacillus mulanensis]|uniref:TrmH family RNA methyltransferase n=1 Tax=Lapidilactobacillus mulanensis TaxID=2485999 RepID=A0ABW4DR60_9LACO|nr:RNA methyltransferase [Lapidilactobacillus mulanensis]